MKQNKSCWISWHDSVRTRTLSKALEIPLYELSIDRNVVMRHFFSSVWTIWLLIKKRPRIIYLQYSFLLLIILGFYKSLRHDRVIIICDCHTKALRRSARGKLNLFFRPVKRLSFRKADIAIISNSELSGEIRQLNANYLVLPDKIPEIKFEKAEKKEKFCVYVSSFATDEPTIEIIQTAAMIDPNIKIYWTGKVPKGFQLPVKKTNNLIFTNNLSRREYYNLIGNADCLMAFTKEAGCLQCGAYEALAVNVPVIVSDTSALKAYFQTAAVYTSHDPRNIANAIDMAIHEGERIKEAQKKITCIRNSEFDVLFSQVKDFVFNAARATEKKIRDRDRNPKAGREKQ